MRFVAAVQTFGILAILIALAYVAYRLFGGGIAKGAQWLKEETPLGAPARAIDSAVSAATGREETLGGFVAEVFNPATRRVNEIYAPESVDPFGGNSNMPGDVTPESVYSINPRDRN